MSKFSDDFPFFDEEPPTGAPAPVSILLSWLKVSFAGPDEQRAAVAEWLKTNVPLPRLKAEIKRLHPALATT